MLQQSDHDANNNLETEHIIKRRKIMNILEKNYTEQERREFWKIYRELEKNPMLLKVIQLAATLDAEDLKECTEYAAWLKQAEGGKRNEDSCI